jgi:hypothetical protein
MTLKETIAAVEEFHTAFGIANRSRDGVAFSLDARGK